MRPISIFAILIFLLAAAAIITPANCQPCTTTVDAGPDQTICTGGPDVQLSGSTTGNVINYFWTPPTGLTDPNILNPLATVSATTTYTLSAWEPQGTNLITNGDFEAQNTGFTSDYNYVDPSAPLGLINPGTYTIEVSPSIVWSNVPGCDDHTFGNGTGYMMLVNGDGTPNEDIWCQTVNVIPNTPYYIDAWITNFNPLGVPNVQFSVDGVLIGNPFSTGALCSWQNFDAYFTSGGSSTIEVCISNQFSGNGFLANDFGLDDIELTGVCVETDDVTINILEPMIAVTPPPLILCNNSDPCITLNGMVTSTILGTITYEWTTFNGIIQSGADTPNPEVCAPGEYTLVVTETLDGSTCESLPLIVVVNDDMAQPPIPTLNGADEFCDGDVATFDIGDDPAYSVILWSEPPGGFIISGQGTTSIDLDLTGAIDGDVCVSVENVCQNIEEVCLPITVLAVPVQPLIAGTNAACQGESQSYLVSNFDPSVWNYIWTVPLDANIQGGQGTDEIVVDWTGSLGGNVCVETINDCGSNQSCFSVSTFPAQDTIFIIQTTCDSNSAGMIVFDLLDQNGCDSIIVENTIFIPADTTNLTLTSCDPNEVGINNDLQLNYLGCDSLIVTTTTLLLSDTTALSLTSCDPNEVGVSSELLTNQNNCDSLVITTTTLLLSDTTALSLTSCDPNEVGVSNELLTNQNNCDSLVITTTTLLLSDTTALSLTSCDPNEVGVSSELLTNQNNCDSLVITTTTLLLSDTTEVSLTSCDPNEVGVSNELLTNQNNCDSLVITTTTLLLSDTTEVSLTSCDPNEVGVSNELLTNQNNCDSLVITTTTLLLSDTTALSLTSCDPNEVGVSNELLTNQNNCDSLVITTTTLLLSDTTEVSLTSCDPNEVGVSNELLTNQNNCDSLVITTTTLLLSDTTALSLTSCDPNEVGVSNELLTNQNNCDSLVITTTTLLLSDTTALSLTSCDPNEVGVLSTTYVNQLGCDSIVLETITLLSGDTTELFDTSCNIMQVGVNLDLLQNENGCDSLVVTTITFSESDTLNIPLTSCDPSEVGVVSTTYVNQLGCDSIVLETITLLSGDTTELFDTSCDITQVGVYLDLLQNGNGCDSLVVTTITFSESDTLNIPLTSCDPSEVGVVSTTYVNQLGCDSIVLETTTLLSGDTTELFDTSCDITQIGVNIDLLQNENGCDSLVVTTITFSESDTLNIPLTSCDPSEVGVVSTTYVNQLGCDSIVIETTTLLSGDTTELFDTSCDITQVGVNIDLLQNGNGCDSLVVTTITFSESDTLNIPLTSCDPSEVGVLSTTYVNQLGCDSIVIETTTLLSGDTTELFDTSCDIMQVGVNLDLLQNTNGCDSLVITTISLLESDTTELFATSCDPNEVGLSIELLINQNGCDSLILISTTLLATSDTTFVTLGSCDPGDIGIDVFDYNNQLGCDSIVVLTTVLLESDTTNTFASSCDPNDVGLATIILMNQYGCDSLIFVETSLLPIDSCSIEATVLGSEIECNESEGSFSLLVELGQAPYTYEWEGTFPNPLGSGVIDSANTIEIIGGLPPGDYSITITSNNGYEIILSTSVIQLEAVQTILTIDSDYNGFDLSCTYAADGMASLSISGGGTAPFTYQWSDGSTSLTAENLIQGWNYVTVSDGVGCMTIDSVLLSSPPAVLLDLSSNDVSCYGDIDGLIEVDTTVGGVPPYLYALNGGTYQTLDSFPNLAAGIFEISVQDANGCEASEVVSVNAPIPLVVDLGADQKIDLGSTITLNAVSSVPQFLLDTIVWTATDVLTCENCLEQEVSPHFNANYSVLLIDENGCTAQDDIVITLLKNREVYIPNAFSPNGDGINDVFMIYTREDVRQINKLQIYDRWGEKVFDNKNFPSNDDSFGWDGRFLGKWLNPGVYVYWAEVEFIDGEVLVVKGDVTIMK